MKIAIIGAGGIGSVAACYLKEAGVDVTLIGRESQLEIISKEGLTINGARGNDAFNIKVLSKLDQEYDLVIFTVKTQDLEDAYQANSEHLENCFVMTTQNGVQADNILSMHFDKERMFSSIVMFGATYIKPGKVTLNFDGDWIIGRPFSEVDPKTHEIAEVLKKAFNVIISDDILGMKYLKLFVNFNNCIPAILGKSMQETFVDMDLCKLSVLLMKEGVDIIQKANIKLVSLPQFPAERISGMANMPLEQAASIINKTLTTLSAEPLYGSILQSIIRKKPSEIDFINGEVVQLAKNISSNAPLNDRIVNMVHNVENTGKFYPADEIKKDFGLK